MNMHINEYSQIYCQLDKMPIKICIFAPMIQPSMTVRAAKSHCSKARKFLVNSCSLALTVHFTSSLPANNRC